VHKEGHYDVDARLQDMDEYGIDTQILSLTTPSVEFLPHGKVSCGQQR